MPERGAELLEPGAELPGAGAKTREPGDQDAERGTQTREPGTELLEPGTDVSLLPRPLPDAGRPTAEAGTEIFESTSSIAEPGMSTCEAGIPPAEALLGFPEPLLGSSEPRRDGDMPKRRPRSPRDGSPPPRRKTWVALLACGALAACHRESSGGAPSTRAPQVQPSAGPAASASSAGAALVSFGEVVRFQGACDASGAVPIDRAHFVLADDEDDWLRVYDAESGGMPLRALDTALQLGRDDKRAGRPGEGGSGEPRKKAPKRKKAKKRKPRESDLEAATRLGDEAYWLSSHGRNRRGKLKQERLVFFATRIPRPNEGLQVVGEPYRNLLHDLLSDPRLRPFQLEAASLLAPKEPGGLNLEGLTATPEGRLLLGFRSPLHQGRALVVPIENPAQIPKGQRPVFGAPIQLSLDGLGIRALSWWRGEYLIIAGPAASGPSRLYAWAGRGHAPRRIVDDFRGLNPEAFFTPEERDEILLLSDDGAQLVDGVPCKRAPAERKSFRGVWMTLRGLARPATR